MRRVFGIIFMIIGALLVAGALMLYLSNEKEDQQAGTSSDEILIQIQQEIQQIISEEAPTESPLDLIPPELLSPEDLVMTERMVNGYSCIGYVSIGELNLELPVISDWSYQKLRVSPCRFSGTVRGEDLVIMAHSYKSHFGRLSTLSEGSAVQFTDMDGKTWCYKVVAMDVLDPTAVDEMIAGEYDLTLFSCTPTGKHRVTVRCDLVE